ncbi:MAG: outer membrane beta-barrel protein [Gammaproteobacteria bacterium]|nr:outer membrane beta-barrel protein [Gammaproteobacteria bacterium]
MTYCNISFRGTAALLLAGLLACAAAPASGQAARSGFYVGGDAGLVWRADFRQQGRNQEMSCYFTGCETGFPGGEPGYRWEYEVDTDTGLQFGLSAGWMWNQFRLEINANHARNDATHRFRSSSLSDGSPACFLGTDCRLPSSAQESETSGVGRIETRSLFANVYYDFPGYGDFIPYVGAGIGRADVKVTDVRYISVFVDSHRPTNRRRVVQDTDMEDTVYAWQLHAGADYRVNRRFLVGLKVSYTDLDDFSDTNRYDEHTDEPNLTNRTKFAGIDYWSALFTVKYLFGQ